VVVVAVLTAGRLLPEAPAAVTVPADRVRAARVDTAPARSHPTPAGMDLRHMVRTLSSVQIAA